MQGSEPTLTTRLALATAQRIDRRRFFRKSAKAGFFMFALAAAGGGIDLVGTRKAFAHVAACSGSSKVGLGCPGASYGYPCGPSRCCAYIRPGYPATCNCDAGGGNCYTNGNCAGKQYNIYSTGCWTCTYVNGSVCKIYTTTCCDCGTINCGDSSGRCVAYTTPVQNGCSPEALSDEPAQRELVAS